MKKLFILAAILLTTLNVSAQVPGKMSYQAVVRDAANELIINKEVGIQISILQGADKNIAVFVENHTSRTNENGLVTLQIGNGANNSGTFGDINWSEGSFFIKIEIDPHGGRNYTISGSSELLSVPYAFHSGTASELIGEEVAGLRKKVKRQWLTKGNDDVNAEKNYIGTKNDADMVFKTNDVERMRLTSDGVLSTEAFQLTPGATSGYVLSSDVDGNASWETPTIPNLNDVVASGNTANNQLKNVTDPTDAQDAATKAYVDLLEAQIAALDARIMVLEEVAHIGDLRAGGIVFYVDETGRHGFICALSDYPTMEEWGCFGTDLPSIPNETADGFGIPWGPGDGMANTNGILNDCPDAPAALAARSYGPEWFLPGSRELELMYNFTVNAALIANGGEALSGLHWSSSESDSDDAWNQNFNGGYWSADNKNETRAVRAVKAF